MVETSTQKALSHPDSQAFVFNDEVFILEDGLVYFGHKSNGYWVRHGSSIAEVGQEVTSAYKVQALFQSEPTVDFKAFLDQRRREVESERRKVR